MPLTINRRGAAAFVWAVAGLCIGPQTAAATADTVTAGSRSTPADSLEWIPFVAPSSEDETYLRYLQIAGTVRPYPWSVRGFSPREARSLTVGIGSHPWSRSRRLSSAGKTYRLLPAAIETRANSAFPYGSNDGPTWAGRGLTVTATVGATVQRGPFSLVLAPTAFITQNASFDLFDNGRPGDLRFGDPLLPLGVDRPQRFGDDPYGALSLGNSALRADVGPFSAGISTANMGWGPFELYPYVLGTNASGFLHGFAGTARPLSIWIGSVHGRVVWGRLGQSEYSPVQGSPTWVSPDEPGTRRFGSGLVGVFTPKGVSGLELGIARFFHSPWPEWGIPRSYLIKPFERILKVGLADSRRISELGLVGDNQLISGFARWAFPAAGLEVYAEYGREDHSWDKRDFLQEPDHARSYGLGFRKVMTRGADRLDGLTFELINFQLPHLARTGRGEGGVYWHGGMQQGHTNEGQLLGAPVGVGAAAGSTIRWDRYAPNGRTALSLERVVVGQRGDFYQTGRTDPKSSDVRYSLEGVRARVVRRLEISTGLALIYEFNRNFEEDAAGISATFGARFR